MHRPSILFLVHRVPYPPDKGDRIRTFNVLRFLAERADVDLACLADEPVADDTLAALHRYCRRVAVVPLGRLRWARAFGAFLVGRTITTGAFRSPRLRRVVRHWALAKSYSAVLASSSAMVPYLRMPELADVPAVIDLIDVDSQKWFDYAASKRWPKSWLYRLEGRRLRKLECDLPSWARAVTLVSEAEADIYRRFAPPGPICCFTNGVDLDYFTPDASAPAASAPAASAPARDTCIFVGALDYYPNIDGVRWFCEAVWPAVRARRARATLRLVGRRPVPAVQELVRFPGVEIVADVPDVRPELQRAAVAVVPLRIARGLQNKVLEALAMKRAVVASAQALAALRVRPGIELLTAADAGEWADSILRLFDDSALRGHLGEAGRAYVEANHDWDACLQPLGRLLNLAGPAPAPANHACARAVPFAVSQAN